MGVSIFSSPLLLFSFSIKGKGWRYLKCLSLSSNPMKDEGIVGFGVLMEFVDSYNNVEQGRKTTTLSLKVRIIFRLHLV